MPSVWSAVTPDSTALGLATLDASTSVIAFSVLPLPPLQSEPRDQDGGEQERDHGGGDGCPLARYWRKAPTNARSRYLRGNRYCSRSARSCAATRTRSRIDYRRSTRTRSPRAPSGR